MPLQPIVDSIEEMPEVLQAEYVQTEDGKYKLDVVEVGGYALENVDALRSALGAEKAARDDFKKKLKAYGDIDATDLQGKLSRLEELEAIDPNKEADKLLSTKLDSIKAQMVAEHTKQLKAAQEKGTKTEQHLKKVLIDDAAKTAITAAGGSIPLLLNTVKERLSLQETESGFATVVRDELGNPMIGDSNGTPMSVSQLVERLKGDAAYQPAFQASGQSGGGMPPKPNGGMPAGSNVNFNELSNKEKAAFIAANPDTWMATMAKSKAKS